VGLLTTVVQGEGDVVALLATGVQGRNSSDFALSGFEIAVATFLATVLSESLSEEEALEREPQVRLGAVAWGARTVGLFCKASMDSSLRAMLRSYLRRFSGSIGMLVAVLYFA